jgi:hypothetical protein
MHRSPAFAVAERLLGQAPDTMVVQRRTACRSKPLVDERAQPNIEVPAGPYYHWASPAEPIPQSAQPSGVTGQFRRPGWPQRHPAPRLPSHPVSCERPVAWCRAPRSRSPSQSTVHVSVTWGRQVYGRLAETPNQMRAFQSVKEVFTLSTGTLQVRHADRR